MIIEKESMIAEIVVEIVVEIVEKNSVKKDLGVVVMRI